MNLCQCYRCAGVDVCLPAVPYGGPWKAVALAVSGFRNICFLVLQHVPTRPLERLLAGSSAGASDEFHMVIPTDVSIRVLLGWLPPTRRSLSSPMNIDLIHDFSHDLHHKHHDLPIKHH